MIIRLLTEVALASGAVGFLTHLVIKQALRVRAERRAQRARDGGG